ncbi:g683 [Coccomyxa viridis]|uniref:Beta-galactosidase n=1 Tax=Coccomyxa viridis TaxID=1274662 RepID=A0ABP1FGA0_9CHLO
MRFGIVLALARGIHAIEVSSQKNLVKSERSFTIENDRFVKDGKPLQIISGSIHYHRIHPVYWKDRLQRVQAMGLNTIELYTPWNFHERTPGKFTFEGFADVERFLDIAQDLGLNVLLRVGPYICGEWDFGGFPWWLASSKVEGGRTMELRKNDANYLAHVERWFNVLLPRMAPYLYHRGGPILMTQIENEYGFCGFNDKDYLQNLVDITRASLGKEAILFTTDPPNVVTMGGLYGDDVISIVDFGPGTDVNYAFTAQTVMNPLGKSPPMCSEFYTGWLSHWGEVMANTSAQFVLQTLTDILSYKNGTGSVNFYMAHGGSNFGYWAGANMAGQIYQPHITSYDYDCPISEAGGIGQPGIGGDNKFKLIRDVIEKQTGITPPKLPKAPAIAKYGKVELNESAVLLEQLSTLFPGDGIATDYPDIMEEYGQSGGLILYRTTIKGAALQGTAVLDISEPVRDYARVLINGKVSGFFERSNPRNLPLPNIFSDLGPNEEVTLDILVEALGRVNFGCVWDYKGLTSPEIKLNGEVLKGWRVYPLQLDNLEPISYSSHKEQPLPVSDEAAVPVLEQQLNAPAAEDIGPIFYRGTFTINGSDHEEGMNGHLPDTFVSVRGWGKGLAWINGHNLGWYWPSIGPQEAQYIPGPWLKEGKNELIFLEVEKSPSEATAPLTGQADLYGPSYSSGRLAQRPPLYDRSIYMPNRPNALPEQGHGLRPRQAIDLGLRRGYHTGASVSAV